MATALLASLKLTRVAYSPQDQNVVGSGIVSMMIIIIFAYSHYLYIIYLSHYIYILCNTFILSISNLIFMQVFFYFNFIYFKFQGTSFTVNLRITN